MFASAKGEMALALALAFGRNCSKNKK